MLIASLIKYLASQPNVSRAACVQAGLIFDTGGEIYDRFRARLMIPIHDAHGRVIALPSLSAPSRVAAAVPLNDIVAASGLSAGLSAKVAAATPTTTPSA